MRIVERTETYTPGEKFRLWGLGDFHAGAPDFAEDALKRHIRLIREDRFARWIGMGDYGELIDHRDPRWASMPMVRRYRDAMYEEGGIPSETVAHVTELLQPIAGKCIGFLSGNHETKVYKHHDRDIVSEIAADLSISHLLLGYSGFVRWKFRRSSSKSTGAQFVLIIHAHHGHQGGRRPGAKINQAQIEKSQYPSAHIIMRGHGHDRVAHIYDSLEPGTRNVRPSPWAFVMTGTYKVGNVDHQHPAGARGVTYEDHRGHAPKHRLGPPVITVTPTSANGEAGTPVYDLEVTV